MLGLRGKPGHYAFPASSSSSVRRRGCQCLSRHCRTGAMLGLLSLMLLYGVTMGPTRYRWVWRGESSQQEDQEYPLAAKLQQLENSVVTLQNRLDLLDMAYAKRLQRLEEATFSNKHLGHRSRRIQHGPTKIWGGQTPRWLMKANAMPYNPDAPKVVFLHIGKTGGTSLENMLMDMCKNQGACNYVSKPVHEQNVDHPKHFDWTYVEQKYLKNSADVKIFTFLRDPVARSISQFYYSKNLPWTKGMRLRRETLREFLDDDPGSQNRMVVHDGEAGSWWLCGAWHSGGYIMTDGKDSNEKRWLRTHRQKCARKAADNLEATAWFGLLEDVPRSMELLQATLGLRFRPTLPHSNKGKKHPPAGAAEKELLTSLLQMDLWLYKFAQQLFEARWAAYQATGNVTVAVSPERLPMQFADDSGNNFLTDEELKE